MHTMLFSHPFDPRQLEALALATAIGLLMGLERERRPAALAGVRTFGLTGLLGAISALLAEQLAAPAMLVAGLALVALMIITANVRQPEPNDPGTTSVVALLVLHPRCDGVAGHGRLAVMAAVGSTMLYFKSELRGVASRLTAQDWRSILQFSVLSLIVLPILPNRGFGPMRRSTPSSVAHDRSRGRRQSGRLHGLAARGRALRRPCSACWGIGFQHGDDNGLCASRP
jgi:hypothetical protein